jgi:tricorn protease
MTFKIRLYTCLAFLCMAVFICRFAVAQDLNIKWMQQAEISPDGRWIAFEYQGNVFKVSSAGGKALQLTKGSFYSGYPVWSHNGKSIAFASDKHGNFDVYVMSDLGANILRLTYNSSRDIPYDFSTDDQQVIFGTDRHDVYTSVRFPIDNLYNKLYQVQVSGGKSIMICSAGMDFAHLNENGTRIIFQDKKGSENIYRQHHTSSITRDIWTYELKTKKYQQLSSFKGDDLEPVWGRDNDFYYLSERSGTLNLYKGDFSDTANVKQLTKFTNNPVRNLSRANNGRFVFTWNGDLYTFAEGGHPEKITVNITGPPVTQQLSQFPVAGNITEMTVSNDGKQVAYICRGDVFVSSSDGLINRQITRTPYQERMVSFSPDGRKLLCSVEHDNSWDIEQMVLNKPEDQYFYAASDISTNNIIATDQDEFQGVYSPDGQKIAYIENRDVLKCFDLKSNTSRTLIPEGVNYSSEDGDQYFTWSPDSHYVLAQSTEGGGGFENEVVLIKDDGSGKRINLTKSGFIDEKPMWGMNGTMMYWSSDKLAEHSFTIGGPQRDVFGMFFDHAAWDQFQLAQQDSNYQAKTEQNNQSSAGLMNHAGDFPSQRLTTVSTDMTGAVLSPDGKELYYLSKYDENYDLWKIKLGTHENVPMSRLNLLDAKLQMTGDGKYIFLLSKGNIIKVSTRDGRVSPLKINTILKYNAEAEREYLFRHTWQIVRKRFMFADYNGVDWDRYYNDYKTFVPYINNNYDFVTLLNELLGELNTSHTKAGFTPEYTDEDKTAALGLLYDETWNHAGLLVKEVISGGPFDLANTKMRPDMIITKIDGTPITKEIDWAALLNKKAGKIVTISFQSNTGGASFTENVLAIKPEMETNTLLYQRWIKQMEHLTDSLSGDRVGYVHLRAMTDEGFRPVYEKALGKYKNTDALIVDTRYNRGGSLHEQVADFLSGKIYLTERRQGRITNGGEPLSRWDKPSCILMSEDNYSDGFLTPYTYRREGIGKLIGMPVAGTGTASLYEIEINPQFGLQIATGATYGDGQKNPTENHQLYPDIEVADKYNAILNGKDEQLEMAVNEMLKKRK